VDVDIWSDIACPWCYIGKRRFEAALAEFEHRDDVRVTWRSFELDPDAPHEHEGDRAARLSEKYGMTIEQAHEAGRRITDVAAGEGLDFRLDVSRELLAGERYAEEVREDERLAGQLGIRAVPTFVVDRALGVSGAEPPEALLGLLRQGWEARGPQRVAAAAESHGLDG
jgi:predicted DsbA family dithiol-disulfide isomerase